LRSRDERHLYRLYEEADFLQRPEFTDAEIFRVSLATVILRMSALGLGEVEAFPFIERPAARAIADGYQLLQELNAIDDQAIAHAARSRNWPSCRSTPKWRGCCWLGGQYHCLNEILIIASALALQDPPRPPSRAARGRRMRRTSASTTSAPISSSYIKLWTWFQEALKHKKTNKLWASDCRDKFLSPLRLREWHELHQQLHAQVSEMGMRFNEQPATYEQIHKALLTGLLGNIGSKGVDREAYYLGPREIKFFIASNSVLAKKGSQVGVAAEIVETTKLFARCVARIEPEWLEEVGAHLIKRSYFDAHWEKKAAQVAAWERSTLYGLVINPKKRVHYGPMNPEESREIFIREALVNGEFNTQAPFFAHNQN